MTRRNSTLSPFLLLSFLALVSCNGLATKGHDPLIFALNLSDSPVSLTLGKEGKTLWEIPSLAAQESRALVRISVADGATLKQGVGGSQSDREWSDPAGDPYSLRFEMGHLYAVVIDPQGEAAVYSLPETYSPDPKLCIVNVMSKTLDQVQVAPAWAKNVKVYAQDVDPVVPSEFYSMAPKTLGLYWQSAEQALAGTHTDAVGADGKPLRMTFETGRYYLFLAGDGSVRDITPTLD